MRSKQSIGFTSVFGFNTGASGTLCIAVGSTKQQLEGKQCSPRAFCRACQHWHYWPIILTSAVIFSHTQQTQHAGRAPIIVAAMKQERKFGFRGTVPLRSPFTCAFHRTESSSIGTFAAMQMCSWQL